MCWVNIKTNVCKLLLKYFIFIDCKFTKKHCDEVTLMTKKFYIWLKKNSKAIKFLSYTIIYK